MALRVSFEMASRGPKDGAQNGRAINRHGYRGNDASLSPSLLRCEETIYRRLEGTSPLSRRAKNLHFRIENGRSRSTS
jgi:hypothetical protein